MLIVTPNLCFDRIITLPRFEPGAVLRAQTVEQTAGGKGVNVARVLARFGQGATLVGSFARPEAERMRSLLQRDGVDAVLVPVEAPHGRTAMIFHEPDGETTVINEPGELTQPGQWHDFTAAVLERIDGAGTMACSGSLPDGAPVDGYAALIAAGNAAGLTTVLDTAPAPLAATLPAHPDLVTPNLEEAEAALSGRAGDVLVAQGGDVHDRAFVAAERLIAGGARRAAVTVGAEGVAFVGTGTRRWVPSVKVEAVSAVGAGDSFVAGLLLADLRPYSPDEAWVGALYRAVATAAASVESPRPGDVHPPRVAELLGRLDRGGAP